ncbi:efflux RND transporter periplasmic adaptor subunit [Paenibacillus sp. TRM 82003]|nr:efflux RND transporter periplasmic adaptor subunit [Paenibacillus sp. TRM 82003]
MSGSRQKKLLSALTLVLVAAVSSACSMTAGESEDLEMVHAVEAVTVALEPLPDRYALAGTMQAMNEAVVSFEVDGQVTETLAESGDVVNAGDTLASLDAANYELQLQRVEGALGQAEAAVSQALASVAAAETNVAASQQSKDVMSKNAVTLAEEAYQKAAYDLNKVESMYNDGDVTETEMSNARLAFIQAETNYTNAKAQSNQSSLNVTSAKATLAQAQAGLQQAEAAHREALAAREQAKLAVDKSSLQTPIAGIVLEKFVSVGQLTGGGQAAYRIGDISQLKVLLPVPDQDIRSWSAGQEVVLSLYGESRTGTVKSVHPTTNAGSGSVNVEVIVQNPNADWLPGQVVEAARTSNGAEGILVPIEAVLSTGREPYVFKHVDGKAVKTPVTLGELVNNRLHVVSGLQQGDQIVIKGASKLFDGDSLAVSEERAK